MQLSDAPKGKEAKHVFIVMGASGDLARYLDSTCTFMELLYSTWSPNSDFTNLPYLQFVVRLFFQEENLPNLVGPVQRQAHP